MLIRLALLWVVAVGGCSQSRPNSPVRGPKGAGEPSVPSTPPLAPLGSGPVSVRGGERFVLRGVTVTVDEVTSIGEPCPQGAKCIHAGVIQLVHFRITRAGGAEMSAAVRPGAPQVVDGVRLEVKQVRTGPVADIEATLVEPPP